MTIEKQYQLFDLSKFDKKTAKACIDYMKKEKSVVSLTATLPTLGSVTITANGEIYQTTYS